MLKQVPIGAEVLAAGSAASCSSVTKSAPRAWRADADMLVALTRQQ
jgi:hypothetical protein